MVASSNGTLEKTLTAKRPMTAGYRPNLPVGMLWGNGMNPLWRILADIEVMRTHPRVRMALAYYKGAIANAEFEITASDQAVLQFVEKELTKFWETSRSIVQNACEYGWGGFELMYEYDENGFLRLSKLVDFHPTHCWAMTSKREYCGIKVTHIDDSPDGFVYLWGPRRKPAKGFWFTHNPRYSKWYGISQLYAAWRPWSRLARPDGAEEIIDGAIYRHGFQGPLGRYPYGSSPPEEAGGMMKDNANLMMEMLEKAKYGASIALPSTRLDGEYDWEVEFPSNTLNVDGLMNYVDYLSKEIERGIGVPPELIEASETGSGYSGRAIPLEGFFTTQQENAEAIVKAWKEQIGDPLVRWNFGGGSRFEVKVKPLLDSRIEKNKPAAPVLDQTNGMNFSLGTAHAPKGGITVQGKKFVGGEFIPGDVLAKASPEEKAKLGVGGKQAEPQADENPRVISGIKAADGQRVFTGKPVNVGKISKQLAGKIGEEIAIDHLKQMGFADARHMNLDRNNFPVDLIQDHEAIEVKCGQVSNGPRAQQWRLTIGEPGKAEKARIALMSKEEKNAWNLVKQQKIHERKRKVAKNLEKKFGRPVKTATITVILNPETKTADIYKFQGWYDRIGWNSPEAQKGFVRTVSYA